MSSIKCFYTNSDNSLLCKLDELKTRLTTDDVDVLLITEIKPKSGTIPPKQLLQLTGYDLHLNEAYPDSNTRGVAIYIKQSLNATLVETTESMKFKDSVWISIPGKQNDNLLIGCVYRSGSPDKAQSLDPQLHTAIKHMTLHSNHKRVLIAGDLNHPKILWTPAPVLSVNHISENHPDVKFADLVTDTMLHQHVNQPTRDRDGQQPTLDDLILTSDPDMIDHIEHTSHLGASDHQCLKFNVYSTFTKAPPKKKTILKYNKADLSKIKEDLDIDWETALEGKSSDDAYAYFLDKYQKSCDKHVPKVTITEDEKFPKPIWMKPATQRLIKRKHRQHTKKLNTQSEEDKAKYREIRNKVTNETRADRKAFERNISKEIKNNNKLFWRYVNATRISKSSIPDLEDKDGTKVTANKEKAELLNKQFASVFTEEDKSNVPKQEEIPLNSILSDINITPAKVKKKLDKLRTDKSCGPDGVHPLILKNLSSTLAKPLCNIFNITLRTGEVPSVWKEGVVTAIFKKGKKSLPENYRAITLTSIVCKTLETPNN